MMAVESGEVRGELKWEGFRNVAREWRVVQHRVFESEVFEILETARRCVEQSLRRKVGAKEIRIPHVKLAES